MAIQASLYVIEENSDCSKRSEDGRFDGECRVPYDEKSVKINPPGGTEKFIGVFLRGSAPPW